MPGLRELDMCVSQGLWVLPPPPHPSSPAGLEQGCSHRIFCFNFGVHTVLLFRGGALIWININQDHSRFRLKAINK